MGRTLLNLVCLWIACASTLGRGKLVDVLSSSQFDSLVKVLSLLSSAQDFRHLLKLVNLREVFDHPKEFVLLKIPHLNFESSGDARAKERVQSHLLSFIHEAFVAQIQEVIEEMVVGD